MRTHTAGRGARVILGCRNKESAQQVAEQIKCELAPGCRALRAQRTVL